MEVVKSVEELLEDAEKYYLEGCKVLSDGYKEALNLFSKSRSKYSIIKNNMPITTEQSVKINFRTGDMKYRQGLIMMDSDSKQKRMGGAQLLEESINDMEATLEDADKNSELAGVAHYIIAMSNFFLSDFQLVTIGTAPMKYINSAKDHAYIAINAKLRVDEMVHLSATLRNSIIQRNIPDIELELTVKADDIDQNYYDVDEVMALLDNYQLKKDIPYS